MSPQEFFNTTIAECEADTENEVWDYQFGRLSEEEQQQMWDENLAMFELDSFRDGGGKLS
jgi:hypothetical protein